MLVNRLSHIPAHNLASVLALHGAMRTMSAHLLSCVRVASAEGDRTKQEETAHLDVKYRVSYAVPALQQCLSSACLAFSAKHDNAHIPFILVLPDLHSLRLYLMLKISMRVESER